MLSDPGKPSRRESGTSALVLVLLGGFILAVLVKMSDNAYLGLALIGVAVLAVSCPFALAALIPYGSIRRTVVILSFVLLWLVTALGGLMLVSLIVGIPSWQHHDASALIVRHMVGFILQAIATYLISYRVLRRAGRDVSK